MKATNDKQLQVITNWLVKKTQFSSSGQGNILIKSRSFKLLYQATTFLKVVALS